MYVSHDEQPGTLEKVFFGVIILGLVVLSVIGVLLWAAPSTDPGADSRSISGQDRIAAMDAADAGMRQQEAWEIANRDIHDDLVSQMDAFDASRRTQEQTELQFPTGRPVQ